MRYVTSVSKMYKHRGYHIHRESTKKYWHIIGYEDHDHEEKLKMFCEQISWIKVLYYKCNKYKKVKLTCPNCKTTYYHFVKKEKDLGKEECTDCYEKFKDLYEEYMENQP